MTQLVGVLWQETPDDTWGADILPGAEQLLVKPGRSVAHARGDTNIEPVFMHSLSHKFHEELIHSYCIHALVDGTPGGGAAAFAAITKRIPYLGLCLSDAHKDLLTQRLLHLVFKEMEREGSVLYEPGMAAKAVVVAGAPSPNQKKRPGHSQSTPTPKKRAGVINMGGGGGGVDDGDLPDEEESDEGE